MPNIQPIIILRERELQDLALKVSKAKESINILKYYSKEEFDRMIELEEVINYLLPKK